MRSITSALSLALAVCFPITVGAEELGPSYSEARLKAFLSGQPEFISPVGPPWKDHVPTIYPEADRPIGCPRQAALQSYMKRLQQRILVECEKTVTWTPSARKQYRTVLVFKFSTDGRIQKLRIESASESPQIDSELLKIFMGLPQPEPLPTGLQAEDVDVEFTVRCCGLRNPGALAGSSGSEPTSTTDGTVTGHIVRFKPSPIAAPQSPDKTQRVTSPDLVP